MKYSPILLTALLAASAQAFEIAKDGQARAVVVTPPSPAPAVATAARELTNYLHQITGAEFQIATAPVQGLATIRVGEPFQGKMPDEVFAKVRDARTLTVTGEGTRGPLYAVYRLLEHFGVGFWAPDNESVPHQASLSLPDDFELAEAPCFEYRQPYSDSAYGPAWNAKVGINGDIWAKALPPEFGGSYHIDINQSMAGMNNKKVYEEHPEWFAYRESLGRTSPAQLCTHNQEAIAAVVGLVREAMKKDPARSFISVSMGDNGWFCECPACKPLVAKEGSPTALIVHGANQVAKAVAKEFPKLRLMFLAYWVTERPPETLQLEPNVSVCFAMLDRDHGKPPSATPRHDTFIEQWSKLAEGRVYIWGYSAQFHNFIVPTPTLDLLGPEMRDYRRIGVKGVFSQFPWGSLSDFVDLRTWLFAKLVWNPEQDENELIRQWLVGACGDGAAAPLREYLDLLKVARSRQKAFCYSYYNADTRAWLLDADVIQAYDLFQRAIRASAGDKRHNAQVRQQYASILAVIAMRYNLGLAEAFKAKGTVLKPRAEIVDELEALGNEFRCSTYREWAPYSAFIKALRAGEVLPAFGQAPRDRQFVRIAPEKFLGEKMERKRDVDGTSFATLRVDSKSMGFPFMEQDKGSIHWKVPKELEGRWKVFVTVRSGATIPRQTTAYAGIYTRDNTGEICRTYVTSSPGETGWETIDLGAYDLPANTRIWVVPGVMANADFIDVKEIVLVDPNVF